MSPPTLAPAPVPARDRRLLRRGPWEFAAICIIALGVIMLLQPFALLIPDSVLKDNPGLFAVLMGMFRYSTPVTLFGTVMFIIVSKFPE